MQPRDPRTYAIIGAALEVHQQLRRGFLEAVYHAVLMIEMESRGIPFQHEVELPVYYKGHKLAVHYRSDFICYDEIIVEIKALDELSGIQEGQLLNYLKATKKKVGLLLNFGAKSLEHKRFVY